MFSHKDTATRCKNQINIFNVPEAESLQKAQEIQWIPFWQRGAVKEGKEGTMHTNSFASDTSKRNVKSIFNPKLIFSDKKDLHYQKKIMTRSRCSASKTSEAFQVRG